MINLNNVIKSIHSRPVIWKTDCNEFKLMDVKLAAWEEVVKECNINTVREAKRCWKNLRDNFRQVLMRKQNGVSKKIWKHEEAMEFLIPYIFSRNSHNVYELEIETERLKTDPDDPLSKTDDGDTDENETEEQDIYLPSPKKPKREYNIQTTSERINNSKFEETNKSESITEDSNVVALESFFTSMYQTTLTFPDHLQLKVQRSIFDVVMNAKAECLRDKVNLKKKGS